jgi:hypothetical protein
MVVLPTTHTRVIPPTVWSRARFHNGALITVFGKSKFSTPFAVTLLRDLGF